MGSMPFAFSVHNFISSVGADAGFAAIIGLAVLILLYFAHARETANLREEAALLAQRLQQAEARVAELSRAQSTAPAVAPPPAGVVQVTDQRRGAFAGAPWAPFAPAGMGAPALAAATRVVPVAEPEPELEPAVVPEEPVPMLATAAPSGTPGAAQPALAAAAAPPTTTSASPGLPGPATAAGGNGAGHAPVAAPVGAGAPPPRAPVSPDAGARPRPLPPLYPEPRRSSVGKWVALAVGALAVVAAAVLLVTLTNITGSSKPTSDTQTSNAPAPGRRTTVVFKPSLVTVAVLNGTSTNQLAHHVADKLVAAGYRRGTVATAANQTTTTTVVAYLPGAKNRNDALHVATALRLTPKSVQPINQGTQQVACPSPGACTANVVVTVGADLATL